jgi:hypothetical protein
MKKLFASVICVIFLATLSYAGISKDTKTYNYKDFTSVGVSSGMKLKVTQSDNYSITVTGDRDDLEDLVVEQRGNSLRFRFDRDGWFNNHGVVRVEITMPKLTSLGMSGGSEANINMDIGSDDFSAGLSGGSELKGNLKCGDIHLATSGSSEITLNGNCQDMKLAGSGGSEYHLKNFSAKGVKASLSGGCEATVSMNGKLSFSGSGGSDLIYYGEAELGSIRASGGSGVSRGK